MSDLITTAVVLRIFAAEADIERAVAAADGDANPGDPCAWVGDSPTWLSKMVNRATHPLPVAVPGGQGRSSLFEEAAIRQWFLEEFERAQSAGAPEIESGVATGILVSYSAMAREIGMHPNTLAARLADHAVAPVRREGKRDLYRLRDIWEALLAVAKAEDPDSLPPTERDAHWRAEARKDEVMRTRRDLVETADALAVLGALAGVLRDACDLIPDMLEARCHLSPEALEQIVAAMDTAREDIAAKTLELRDKILTPPTPQTRTIAA
jgi:hypothetical protein